VRSSASFKKEKSFQFSSNEIDVRDLPKTKKYFEPTLPGQPFYLEEVLDYEKRIAGYSSDVKAKYKRAYVKMQEFIDVLAEDSSNFRVTINNKKKGLLCEQRDSEGGIPMVRISVSYEYPAIVAWRANVSGENRPKYDSNIAEVSLIEQLGTNFMQVYQRTRRIATVAPRDVYQHAFSNHYPNGMIRTVLYDNPDDDMP
jgi:hypothetical protein